MLEQKYIEMATKIVKKSFPKTNAFIFGSSLRKKDFFDVDIAIEAVDDPQKIIELKSIFEQSNFPRPVDIVDFDRAEKSFKDYVLNHETKLWI